eukprot:3935159-Rhodomonas_salina.5
MDGWRDGWGQGGREGRREGTEGSVHALLREREALGLADGPDAHHDLILDSPHQHQLQSANRIGRTPRQSVGG